MKYIFTLCLSLFVLQGYSQIIITGFMPSPKRTATNEYNMEYVQLMATKDLTFDNGVNSYTVVICRNGGVLSDGWAQAAQVYSFALTSGSVQKGQYFYVGGTEKIIAGATTADGRSTDISETAPLLANRAKWLSVRDYVNIAGDVVGNKTGDLIQGWTTGTGSSNDNADGIAVFAGTTVTVSTVPLDAVFYGTKIGSAGARVVSGVLTGYTVPVKNDYYKSSDGFFGQASNTFFFNPTGLTPTINGVDNGVFFKLEGVYNSSTNEWTTPRTLKLIDLYNGGNWGTLADIEKNVTLPVSVLSFTALRMQTGEIELKWKTASEQDNARFDIYRASDNKEFKLVGDKRGAGTTTVETSYSFIDHNPSAGTNYYKLVQVDANEKSTSYEKIVAVKTAINSNISVSSNEEYVNVYYKDILGNNASVEIIDMLGHKVFRQVNLSIDGTSLKLPVSLQKGIYVLSLDTGEGNYRVKFNR